MVTESLFFIEDKKLKSLDWSELVKKKEQSQCGLFCLPSYLLLSQICFCNRCLFISLQFMIGLSEAQSCPLVRRCFSECILVKLLQVWPPQHYTSTINAQVCSELLYWQACDLLSVFGRTNQVRTTEVDVQSKCRSSKPHWAAQKICVFII